MGWQRTDSARLTGWPFRLGSESAEAFRRFVAVEAGDHGNGRPAAAAEAGAPAGVTRSVVGMHAPEGFPQSQPQGDFRIVDAQHLQKPVIDRQDLPMLIQYGEEAAH